MSKKKFFVNKVALSSCNKHVVVVLGKWLESAAESTLLVSKETGLVEETTGFRVYKKSDINFICKDEEDRGDLLDIIGVRASVIPEDKSEYISSIMQEHNMFFNRATTCQTNVHIC